MKRLRRRIGIVLPWPQQKVPWIMSNVTLDTKGRPEYISGPIKNVYVALDEKATRFSDLIDAKELPRQLRPPAKISDLQRLTQGKARYDAIAVLSTGSTNERQPNTRGHEKGG